VQSRREIGIEEHPNTELRGMKNKRVPPLAHRCFAWHKVNDSVNRRVDKINEDGEIGRNG